MLICDSIYSCVFVFRKAHNVLLLDELKIKMKKVGMCVYINGTICSICNSIYKEIECMMKVYIQPNHDGLLIVLIICGVCVCNNKVLYDLVIYALCKILSVFHFHHYYYYCTYVYIYM